MSKFHAYHQTNQMDCGPTCLRMIAKHHGRSISIEKLRLLTENARQGTTLRNLSLAAERIGLRSMGVKITVERLIKEAPLPCVVHWDEQHYIVVYKTSKKSIYTADPAHGLLRYSIEEFKQRWIDRRGSTDDDRGFALLFEPTPSLLKKEDDDESTTKGFKFLVGYIMRYKSMLAQVAVGLAATSLLQLIFPFLTQSVVDIGIQNHDISFVYLILIAQLFLFIGRSSIELIRGWLVLHIGARINISLVSDFLVKVMNLPIAYFDVTLTSDFMQRIGDHKRIEKLLTSSSLSFLFAIVNLLIFSAVLVWYDWKIFAIFLTGSTFYFTWVMLFLKRRKDLDYKRFSRLSREQARVMEVFNGMQEIKLHNAERLKRWQWEEQQTKLYDLSVQSLSLSQTQNTGTRFINELKNIFITVFSAKLVIDGEITLGMMMAISYIIGQLNGPVQQLVSFIFSLQDARIALERLSEIHNKEDEEAAPETLIRDIDQNSDFTIENITFRYPGTDKNVLENLSLTIPARKTTAIVGASGSGKTTLMKILLKFYSPQEGEVRFGNFPLDQISPYNWRELCGTVMQEGYIFSDSIAKNIALGEDHIERNKLRFAARVSNILEFIEELPLGFDTKIGSEGLGISTGQKQRLLMARSVYKNPDIIFFDEATSALDAKNERVIMENLEEFFTGKTAVVIAHRLSTVRNADQIVVLNAGQIVECGTHDQLIAIGGKYFNLVKNQLEMEKLHAEV